MTLSSASLDTAAIRNTRGAFFTPEPIARFFTKWGVWRTADKITEPPCGEAAFDPDEASSTGFLRTLSS